MSDEKHITCESCGKIIDKCEAMSFDGDVMFCPECYKRFDEYVITKAQNPYGN